MVQRPLARIKIDRGPLNDLGAIVSRLQLLVELLDALLDIRMAAALDVDDRSPHISPHLPPSRGKGEKEDRSRRASLALE